MFVLMMVLEKKGRMRVKSQREGVYGY